MLRKNILFLVTIISFFLTPASLILAQDEKLPVLNAPNIQVTIPSMEPLQNIQCEEGSCSIPWLAQYIAGLQNYAIGIVGVIAVIVLMIGGIIWLTAAGNNHQIDQAKKLIGGSVIGVFLVLSAYSILYIINPNLTVLNSINLRYINRVDLPEIEIDTVELNKNIEDIKTGGKIRADQYCGCFDYRNTKSTTKLNSAATINDAIAFLAPSSPLKNKGQVILDSANKFGLDPALFVSKCKQENGLGTANSTIVREMKNLASISCPDGSSVGSKSQTAGCKAFTCAAAKNGRLWRSYPTWEDSIEDYFCFIKNSKVMGPSTSLRELLTKYCPPCLYKGKCDCNTADYINTVASIMQNYNSNSFSNDKPAGNNCGCYDMTKHCKDRTTQYCTNYGQ